MDGPGDQGLPGPGFPGQHDRGVRGRDPFGLFQDPLHGRAVGLDLAQPVDIGLLPPEVIVGVAQGRLFKGPPDGQDKVFQVQGLFHEIKSALPHGLHGRLHRAVLGDYYYRGMGEVLLDVSQDLQAVFAGDAQLGHHGLKDVAGEQLHGLDAASGLAHLKSGGLE